jgi:hypothetical protein
MTPRIFVSIASYRDTECQWTVKDLFEKASKPERVFVGLCWQFIREEDADCFLVRTRPDQCRSIEVDARESRGVCWARAQIQSLWQGEEYVLQIDAHSRFAQGWDELLLADLLACPTPRAVLSTYPATYVPPDKLGKDLIALITPKEFDHRGVMTQGSRGVPPPPPPAAPQPTPFIGAGTLFAPAAIIREVPYDPHIYFTGEEITLAARLWTHGWDIFTPTRVTVYHEYSERPNKRRHWEDHKLWVKLSERGAERVRHLMGTEASKDPQVLQDIERFGLGSQRSLAQYEAFAKVDFKRKLIGGENPEQLEAALPTEERCKRIRARFTEIWRHNTWGSKETRSGQGSTLAQTEALRRRLVEVFGELGVRRLVDAGCGELNWMSRISEPLELYLGFDVVDELVEGLRQRFEPRKNHFFNTADVTRDVLPAADAILCRDVLTHLNHGLVKEALGLFCRSGSRLLIATTFARGRNDPVRIGGWQPMDLCAEPFNLPQPRLVISEELKNSVKSLGVWALDDLRPRL